MKTATRSQSAYSTFVAQAKAGKIESALIKPYRVDYQLKEEFGGKSFFTHHSNKQAELQTLLNENDIEFATQQSGSGDVAGAVALLLSSGIMMGAFALLAKFADNNGGGLGGGLGGLGNGVGKSKARVYDPRTKSKTGVTFADVAGIDESKQELQEVVDFLKDGRAVPLEKDK